MAFNPFEVFSIRSKVGRSVMAVLTIAIMLIFVLSMGAVGSGHDFFDQIGGLFSSGNRGEVVAKAYGDDVRESELNEIHKQRRIAREYLGRAMNVSYNKWAADLSEDVKAGKLTPETKRALNRFLTLRAGRDKNAQGYFAFINEFFSFQFGPEVRSFQDAMQKARLKPDSDDKKALDAMATILLHDRGLMPFFLVELGDTDRHALDFLLLLRKADRMGIQFSRDGVMEMVKRDTAGRLIDKDLAEIEAKVRTDARGGQVSGDWLAEAIGNEYRARTALAALQGKSLTAEMIRQQRSQQAMLFQFIGIDLAALAAPGDASLASAFPGSLTPYEFFEYYKDKCSENTFQVIEVKAEAFLDQVTGEPTPKERTELFGKHRGEVPDPSRDRPGFKEPRKVKVEFVTLDATAPRITQAIPKVQAASLFLCASGGAIGGNPAAALASAAQPAMADTLPVRDVVASKMEANLARYPAHEQFDFIPRDTSMYRPQPIVSALGMLAGGNLDLATLANTYATVHQHVERAEHRTRVPFLLQPVLTPFNPTLANAIGMPAFAYALNPKLPPEGLYLPEAVAAAKKKQRHNLFEADARELRTKMFKITMDSGTMFGQKPDKAKDEKARADARKLIDEWVKERGLTIGGTAEPRDQFTIVTDPGLKPLNDLATSEPDGSNSLATKLFAQDPRARTPVNDVQPFQPEWFPTDLAGIHNDTEKAAKLDKANHLMWVSQDVEAKAYNNLENANRQLGNNEMTRRVDAAWKLEKARALAKAEADRLAEQVKAIAKTVATDPGGVDRQLRDLAGKDNRKLFELERLAPLMLEKGATQARIDYKPPTILKTQVLYPGPEFTEKLLQLRKEPLGAVTVLADQPRVRYYVACVVGRTEKTVDQFKAVYDKAAAGLGQDPLYDRALSEERVKAADDVFERLRAEAGLELMDAFKNREKKDLE